MKINFDKQVSEARIEIRKSKRRFKKKRKTVLVRIQTRWHTCLKDTSKRRKKTMSKLHDEIYPVYFKNQAK